MGSHTEFFRHFVTGASALLFFATNAHAEELWGRAPELAVQRCAACHTVDGNSNVDTIPSLAGQHPDYLTRQLMMFKGSDGHGPLRHNPLMERAAADLSVDDIHSLATWYSKQVPRNETSKDSVTAATLARGFRVYTNGSQQGAPACIACHGANGTGIPGAFPRLAGQHAEYLQKQLRAYKEGRRGAKGKPMTTIAPLLSPEEISAVALYMSSLKAP
ncbi:c-type cytochrome [Paraburkholderia elongata]|uniref:C-type cytochrome n=1 Tax=Paraburkholderia elongata TaxID=2675747 RepID=A0A972NXV5_9BURK|nr:c-type cytochrome [Paraburkholderia elongata]NPT59762.1 c-type cytochrome [Paraburkholderia elongata]